MFMQLKAPASSVAFFIKKWLLCHFLNAQLASEGLGRYFSLCTIPHTTQSTQPVWVHLYDNCMFLKQFPRERQFRSYTVITVVHTVILPAVGMNTDHVVGLRPAANCSCCNWSWFPCLEFAMWLFLAVIGRGLCWNCSLFTRISYYNHYIQSCCPVNLFLLTDSFISFSKNRVFNQDSAEKG